MTRPRPQGLHRVIDPAVAGIEAAEDRLRTASHTAR
jgi:hypothetical protein